MLLLLSVLLPPLLLLILLLLLLLLLLLACRSSPPVPAALAVPQPTSEMTAAFATTAATSDSAGWAHFNWSHLHAGEGVVGAPGEIQHEGSHPMQGEAGTGPLEHEDVGSMDQMEHQGQETGTFDRDGEEGVMDRL